MCIGSHGYIQYTLQYTIYTLNKFNFPWIHKGILLRGWKCVRLQSELSRRITHNNFIHYKCSIHLTPNTVFE